MSGKPETTPTVTWTVPSEPSKVTFTSQTTPEEDVGREMRAYVVITFGREPTQDEFEHMYWAWMSAVERLYDA